jgi:DNA repair protein RadC
MARFPTCNREKIPVVELAFSKARCLRKGSAPVVKTPSDVAALVQGWYGCKPQEHFLVLYLSANNEVMGLHEVSKGGLDQTSVDPRVVFAGVLLAGAPAVILVHNHPSGNEQPSNADEQLTNQMVAAGKLLGIKVLDHVIVARGGGFTSIREVSSGRVSFAGEGYAQ